MTGNDELFLRNQERISAKARDKRKRAAMKAAEAREREAVRGEQARLKAEALQRMARRASA